MFTSAYHRGWSSRDRVSDKKSPVGPCAIVWRHWCRHYFSMVMWIKSEIWHDLIFTIQFYLHRTSVSDDEKGITTRPDASINIVRGASLGQRLGCGEVKPQYQALNHKAIAKDLIRVGHLAKDASDKYQTRMIFGFVVVGKVVYALNGQWEWQYPYNSFNLVFWYRKPRHFLRPPSYARALIPHVRNWARPIASSPGRNPFVLSATGQGNEHCRGLCTSCSPRASHLWPPSFYSRRPQATCNYWSKNISQTQVHHKPLHSLIHYNCACRPLSPSRPFLCIKMFSF